MGSAKFYVERATRWVRRKMRVVFWRSPRLYRMAGLAKRRFPAGFDDHQDFLILGYPRSANTYSGHYLRISQPPEFAVLFQLHFPPQALEALRRGIPHLLLLRAPQDAVLSYAILTDTRVVDQLDYYIDYHRALLGNRGRLFIVRFEDATSRLRDVMTEAERHFPIRFDWSMPVEEAENRTRQAVHDQALHEDGTLNHRYYNLPSETRVRMASELEGQFAEPETAARLVLAERMYRTFLANAIVLPNPPVSFSDRLETDAPKQACGADLRTTRSAISTG